MGVREGIIGSLPTAIRLSRIDLFQSSRSHVSGFHQSFGVSSIIFSTMYSITYRLQTAKKRETRDKRMQSILEQLARVERFH